MAKENGSNAQQPGESTSMSEMAQEDENNSEQPGKSMSEMANEDDGTYFKWL